MKTIYPFLLSLLFVACLPCFGLNYTITFTGSGTSTTVGDVIVQNLTKGTTVTVPTGNVLNLIDGSSGVEDLNANDETIRVYPNSEKGVYTLSFFAEQVGNTQINAYTTDGRKIVSINQNLQTGSNSFHLSLPGGSYAIQVIGNGYSYNAKIIIQSTSLSNPAITYFGAEKPLSATPQKSKSSSFGTTTMIYATGDRLLYKGTSGINSGIVTDVPTTSKTINFEFADCKDVDGNNYCAVKIGTQIWMVENLKTTKYLNGDVIANITNAAEWNVSTTAAVCEYNNDASNGTKYGKLYNWYAVADSRKIAPQGWHVATDAEWTTLGNYVAANLGTSLSQGKALATTFDWTAIAIPGSVGSDLSKNNATGFSALPAGNRFIGAGYFSVGLLGSWWSSTESSATGAWNITLGNSYSNLFRSKGSKGSGMSVRCVKD